jgi:hypothetical protein
VSRCGWPDGGCGAEVIFVPSAKTGKNMILDATPEKRVVLELQEIGGTVGGPGTRQVARVVDTYLDHHGSCSAFAAKVERERAAKAARP